LIEKGCLGKRLPRQQQAEEQQASQH
jgi:hypothetical protein